MTTDAANYNCVTCGSDVRDGLFYSGKTKEHVVCREVKLATDKLRALLVEAQAYLLVKGVEADSYEATFAMRIEAALAPGPSTEKR